MGNSVSSEICQQCAECCRKHPFVRLSKNEVAALEHVTQLPGSVFSSLIGNAAGEYFLHFQENEACFFLQENNGRYSCGVYEARPGVCKRYPFEDGNCPGMMGTE